MYKTEELLNGAVDMHVHANPDFHPRRFDERGILEDAQNYGLRAVVSKSHYVPNADRCSVINTLFEDIDCFGGIVLNPSAGGFNPYAVEAAIRFGAKEVWMPSFYSKEHILRFPAFKGAIEYPGEGMELTTAEGKLQKPLLEILDLIRQNDIILGTSHSSAKEIGILVQEANKIGIKKIIITHPYCPVPDLSLDQQAELAEAGAYLELCLYSAMPISGKISIRDFAQTIQRVGASNIVLGTDFGQPFNPTPGEGMRLFCENLLAVGISHQDIEVMIKRNTYKLLNL